MLIKQIFTVLQLKNQNHLRLEGLKQFLALEKNVLKLFIAVLFVTLGENLWIEYVPAYFLALGGSVIALGIFKSFADTLESIAQLPGGMISDKIGRFSASIMFFFLGIFGFTLYLIAPSWQILFIGILLIQGTSSLLQPTIFSIIGDYLPPEKRTNAFSVQSILKRLPIVVSPVVGGFLINKLGIIKGIKTGLVLTIILSIFGVIILVSSRKSENHKKDKITRNENIEINNKINQNNNGNDENKNSNEKTNNKNNGTELESEISNKIQNSETGMKQFQLPKKLSILLIADIFARFGQAMIKFFIVLYVLDLYGPQTLGWLISFQMSIAIISYFPAAYIAERTGRKPVITVGFICFVLYPSLILFSSTLIFLFLGYFVAGFREFGEPARKALIVNLSNSSTRGKNIGLYYMIRSFAIIPAGVLGGYLWLISREITAFIASSVAFLGLITFILFVNE